MVPCQTPHTGLLLLTCRTHGVVGRPCFSSSSAKWAEVTVRRPCGPAEPPHVTDAAHAAALLRMVQASAPRRQVEHRLVSPGATRCMGAGVGAALEWRRQCRRVQWPDAPSVQAAAMHCCAAIDPGTRARITKELTQGKGIQQRTLRRAKGIANDGDRGGR
jgi:hypothetical protein